MNGGRADRQKKQLDRIDKENKRLGKGVQKKFRLVSSGKLYDAYANQNTPIYLVMNSVYMGQYRVSAKPFLKTGRWFFPLSPK